MTIRVTVWNEFRHEKENEIVRAIYPDGLHEAIAAVLRREPDLEVGTATLDQEQHGLTPERLAATDVLFSASGRAWGSWCSTRAISRRSSSG